MATYPNLPFQGRDDLSHHPHQVLILVRVVCEPHSLADCQDLFADEPRMSSRGLSKESALPGGSDHFSPNDGGGGGSKSGLSCLQPLRGTDELV